MSATTTIQVDESRVLVALGKFQLSLQQNDDLMKLIGASMLLSVRRTFREQGSPAASWMPLAPSTIRSDSKRYGAGHKMLIGTGNLLNSIGYQSEPGLVVIGTNLRYAAVHQFGSRDRGGVGFGPRTAEMEKATAAIGGHTRYQTQDRQSGTMTTNNKAGRQIRVRRMIAGPLAARAISVRGHARHQNIPARPYLVFRPEDPRRIQSVVNGYISRARAAAGLEGA